MNYLQTVDGNAQLFAAKDFLKLARDMAKILNSPVFQVSSDVKEDYEIKQIVEAREPLFHDFCAACHKAGVLVPELEPIFYEAYLPKQNKKETEASKEAYEIGVYVEHQLLPKIPFSRDMASVIGAMVEVLKIFPDCGGWHGIEKKSILAVINNGLVELGCLPIRPDYEKREIDFTPNAPAGKLVKILIVDDEIGMLINTARPLLGWENVEVEFLHYHSGSRNSNKKTEKQKVAQAIIDQKPDIVLMDQGLGGLNGHEVIIEFKSMVHERPIFIANTGGSPEDLNGVGAIGNCDKGRKISDVRYAVAELGNS